MNAATYMVPAATAGFDTNKTLDEQAEPKGHGAMAGEARGALAWQRVVEGLQSAVSDPVWVWHAIRDLIAPEGPYSTPGPHTFIRELAKRAAAFERL